MTYTADALALLATIRLHPEEDTPRLVYADCLEENGDPERAEFVRVQCRIAAVQAYCSCGACVESRGGGQHTNGPCATTRRQDDGVNLRRRERELLRAHEARWRAAAPCPTCGGGGNSSWARADGWGFAKCEACAGTGDRGGLTARRTRHDDEPPRSELPYREEYRHRVDYVRGMKRVHCRLHDVCDFGDALVRPVSLRATPWALAVCRHHPDLLELWVTDLEPRGSDGGHTWPWHRDDRAPPGERTVYQYIEGFVREEFDQNFRSAAKLFATEEAARVQLARAAARFVRAHGAEIRT